MKPVVAVLQMDVKTGNVEANLAKAEELLQKAEKYKPDFVVLPEMWATGFAFDQLKDLSHSYLNLILKFLSDHAKKLNAYIIGGSLPEVSVRELYNTSFIFDPSGATIGKQRKMHPFPLTGESNYFSPGKEIKAIDTKFGKIGCLICFDLRFPELSLELAKKGVKILFYPAQWPTVREKHWNILLKARALENQIFVVGANRVGGHTLPHCGRSMLISPWGEKVEETSDKETVLVGELNLAKIDETRNKLPLHHDR
ncbi:MAG: carbon-nitrogen family hydrolase [Candidatus Saganbacteria bacterium]|nr:carbon-nitrogen family hydrolase [Candidatus Saganbacteria bacterium]